MTYSVVFARRARKEIEKIPSPLYDLIEEKILSLSSDPRPPGCQKMKGEEDTWRIRSGNYRIVYEIDDSGKAVIIIKVGHRSSVYR